MREWRRCRMSKAVLISIRPKWCEKICRGEKTVEVRKSRPKMETPFKCYIYETQGWVEKDSIMVFRLGGRVIGEFTCDRIYKLETQSPGGSYYVKGEGQPTTNDVARQSCLSLRDMHEYLQSKVGYGWHISELKICDAPKELSEFRRVCPNDLYCESCAMYRNNGGTCGNGALLLKRPPQSWCYVEMMR